MADVQNTENKLAVDKGSEINRIVRERSLWALKPLGVLGLILWVFHPSTTHRDVVDHNSLIGFLLGAAFALLVYLRVLEYFLISRRKQTLNRKNRMPDEFYWGKIKEILFTK